MPFDSAAPAPAAVPADRSARPHHGSAVARVIAFLLFPYGPFLYLAWLRQVAWAFAVFLVAVSALVHVGLVSVLAATNHQPWQPWLALLLGTAMYCLGLIQYVLGAKQQLWSPIGLRFWRAGGWFLGIILLASMLVQVVMFHLLRVRDAL